MLHPRHRGDCAEFFVPPGKTARIEFDGPVDVIGEMEHAAARAGRTWHAQFTYVMGICLGYHPPDFEDNRSVADWRTLLSECNFRTMETGGWAPFTCLWRRPPQTPVTV